MHTCIWWPWFFRTECLPILFSIGLQNYVLSVPGCNCFYMFYQGIFIYEVCFQPLCINHNTSNHFAPPIARFHLQKPFGNDMVHFGTFSMTFKSQVSWITIFPPFHHPKSSFTFRNHFAPVRPSLFIFTLINYFAPPTAIFPLYKPLCINLALISSLNIIQSP